MIRYLLSVLIASLIISISLASDPNGRKSVLIFTKTVGFRHESIPHGIKCLSQISNEMGFDIDTTENSDIFLTDSIQKYDVVVFLNTTGDIFNAEQQNQFQKYIQNGGNFIGIHAATDTEKNWDWYVKLVGGSFESHPHISSAEFKVMNSTHSSTEHLPKEFVFTDEIYNYKNLYAKDYNVLVTIDESSYEGGKNGDFHPISWFHEYEGSRVFYTNLGHRKESYSDSIFIKHLRGGIKYVLGNPN